MFDSFERKIALNERKKLQCNKCRRQTIHLLEVQCTGKWHEESQHGPVSGWTNFSLYRCGACDEVCFEKADYCSEQFEHDHEGKVILLPDEVQYPLPSSAEFSFDTEFTPMELNSLIEEMLYALTGGKLKLATVAIRMVIEFIVTDIQCAGKSLFKKIDDLKIKGAMDENQITLLHTLREKGNAGTHERIAMTRDEMVASISIINLLLEKFYNGPARKEDIIKKANHAFSEQK